MEWRPQESVNGRHAEGHVHEERPQHRSSQDRRPRGTHAPVNAAWVEKLRDSIEKGQLLQPLVVGVPNTDKLWPLVDGAHRLAR